MNIDLNEIRAMLVFAMAFLNLGFVFEFLTRFFKYDDFGFLLLALFSFSMFFFWFYVGRDIYQKIVRVRVGKLENRVEVLEEIYGIEKNN